MVRFNENFTFSFRAISAIVLVLLLLPVGLFSQEALKMLKRGLKEITTQSEKVLLNMITF